MIVWLLAFILLLDGIKTLVGVIFKKNDIDLPVESEPVSFVISALNEGDGVERSLESVGGEGDEVVLVDDGSTDGTKEVVQEKYPNVQVVDSFVNRGKVQSVFKGLEHVTNDYVCLVDADTSVPADRVGRAASYLRRDPDLGGLAFKVLPEESNFLTSVQDLEYGKAMSLGRSWLARYGFTTCVSGGAGLFRRDLLEKIEWKTSMDFDGEDFERTLHLINRGYEIRYMDTVEAVTTGEEGLAGLFWQRVGWENGFLKRHLQFGTIVKHPPHPSLLYDFVFNWIVVIGLHPLKLLALPILLMNPVSLLAFYLVYVGIDAASLWTVRRSKIHYSLITPLYGLFLLFPRTLGFAKGVYDKIRKKLHNEVR